MPATRSSQVSKLCSRAEPRAWAFRRALTRAARRSACALSCVLGLALGTGPSAPAHAEIAPTHKPPDPEAPPKPRKPYDLTWRPGAEIWLRPGALLQARYTFNKREDPADGAANTSRFTVPRARVILDGGASEYFSFRIRVGTLADGAASFEQGYADLHFGPFTIRGGIFYLPTSIADNPAPHELQALDYSQYGQQNSGGQAAGFGTRFEHGDFRVQAYLSNGMRTAFSELATPLNARIGITGRVEGALFTREGLGRFDSESSYMGSDFGLRLGGAAHWQKGDATLMHGDLEQFTADLTLEGPGFNVITAGSFFRVNPPEGNITHDGGFLVQAGAFVHPRIELWARYDGLFSDGKIHAQPPFRSPATDAFHEFGAGINGYVIPNEQLAKLQLDFLYVPQPVNSTLAVSSSNSGVLATDRGSQWAVRVQMNVGI
jgi:hypothetical protein